MKQNTASAAMPEDKWGFWSVDSRPETSIYAAASITLRTKDETKFTIPRPLLSKYPKLPLPPSYSTIASLNISQDVGHVLVHFLHTNTYQCLKPKGTSVQDRLEAELTTSVGVYAAAQAFEIQDLENLAKVEIEGLGSQLKLPKVLDLVQDAYTDRYTTDSWLCGYLQSSIQSSLQDPSTLKGLNDTEAHSPKPSVNEFVLKVVAGWLRRNTDVPQGPQSVAQDEVLDSSGFIVPALDLPSTDEPAYVVSDFSFGTESTPSGTSPPEHPDDSDFVWPTAIESGYEVEALPSEPEQPIDYESVPPTEPNSEPFLEVQSINATQLDIPSGSGASPEDILYPTLADEILDYERLMSKKKLKKDQKRMLSAYQSRCDGFLNHTQPDLWNACVVCCSRVRQMAGEIKGLNA